MPRIKGSTVYSIAAVSKLTGVSCHVLRVWERRYGFPDPLRSPSGHRRFPEDQVNVLRFLARMAKNGQSIGEVIQDYRAGRLDYRVSIEVEVQQRSPSALLVDRLFAGETIEADVLLDRLSERLSAIELIERIIEPALIDIGERWFRRECDIYQERHAMLVIFVRLGRLLDQARRENLAPIRKVLVGTVKGDRHEGGVMMVSLALELAGWRALPMGVDVPVSEYQKAIDRWQPDALGLSFVLSRNINKRFQEIARIKDIPIFVGGRSIVNHQGLARRHGLIPLVGSLSGSTSRLAEEFDSWHHDHQLLARESAR